MFATASFSEGANHGQRQVVPPFAEFARSRKRVRARDGFVGAAKVPEGGLPLYGGGQTGKKDGNRAASAVIGGVSRPASASA
jgi:hypothetical protein